MENLKLKEILELKEIFLSNDKNITKPVNTKRFENNENYLILTITFFFTGTVIAENDKFVSFKNFSWIADTGRFSDAMKNGIQNTDNSEIEVAPAEQVFNINKEAMLVTTKYADLPTETK